MGTSPKEVFDPCVQMCQRVANETWRFWVGKVVAEVKKYGCRGRGRDEEIPQEALVSMA